MADTLRIVAHIQSRPDTLERVRDLVESLVEPTRAEPGCIRYELHHNDDDPSEFAFIGDWTGADAFDQHMASSHIQDAMSHVPELLAAPPDIRRYRVIG